eukprot:TRINITY_DN66561_c0_g1_i4.p1 TRINITY_DN66561_c0_g1~~TRINITY_DN66561_c0_g1_i4.p1  ORF type:complete len:146 (+),score=8.43 TRINITY_DN66561_c0_g1_i4:68-505(+)
MQRKAKGAEPKETRKQLRLAHPLPEGRGLPQGQNSTTVEILRAIHSTKGGGSRSAQFMSRFYVPSTAQGRGFTVSTIEGVANSTALQNGRSEWLIHCTKGVGCQREQYRSRFYMSSTALRAWVHGPQRPRLAATTQPIRIQLHGM